MAGVAALSLAGCGSSADDQATGAAQLQPAATELVFDGATSDNHAVIQAHGERLSHVLGCRGCHTPTLEGANFGVFEPPFDGIYASNLTRILPDMSDEQLERSCAQASIRCVAICGSCRRRRFSASARPT